MAHSKEAYADDKGSVHEYHVQYGVCLVASDVNNSGSFVRHVYCVKFSQAFK